MVNIIFECVIMSLIMNTLRSVQYLTIKIGSYYYEWFLWETQKLNQILEYIQFFFGIQKQTIQLSNYHFYCHFYEMFKHAKYIIRPTDYLFFSPRIAVDHCSSIIIIQNRLIFRYSSTRQCFTCVREEVISSIDVWDKVESINSTV